MIFTFLVRILFENHICDHLSTSFPLVHFHTVFFFPDFLGRCILFPYKTRKSCEILEYKTLAGLIVTNTVPESFDVQFNLVDALPSILLGLYWLTTFSDSFCESFGIWDLILCEIDIYIGILAILTKSK